MAQFGEIREEAADCEPEAGYCQTMLLAEKPWFGAVAAKSAARTSITRAAPLSQISRLPRDTPAVRY